MKKITMLILGTLLSMGAAFAMPLNSVTIYNLNSVQEGALTFHLPQGVIIPVEPGQTLQVSGSNLSRLNQTKGAVTAYDQHSFVYNCGGGFNPWGTGDTAEQFVGDVVIRAHMYTNDSSSFSSCTFSAHGSSHTSF